MNFCLTREKIDQLCPEHGRTSCDDNNTMSNGHGGWDGYYSRETGKKEIRIPRCTRCYLLEHEGEQSDELDFEIEVKVNLIWRDTPK